MAQLFFLQSVAFDNYGVDEFSEMSSGVNPFWGRENRSSVNPIGLWVSATVLNCKVKKPAARNEVQAAGVLGGNLVYLIVERELHAKLLFPIQRTGTWKCRPCQNAGHNRFTNFSSVRLTTEYAERATTVPELHTQTTHTTQRIGIPHSCSIVGIARNRKFTRYCCTDLYENASKVLVRAKSYRARALMIHSGDWARSCHSGSWNFAASHPRSRIDATIRSNH